jgi:recombination protein RecA
MEHAFNPKYAKDAGVDLTSLIFIQPQNGNKATDYVELFAKTGEVSLIVLDSVAALVTEQEEQSSMDETTMSLGTAKLMAKFCRKIPPVLSATDTTLIMINQWREKPTPYGNPKVSYGGHALKYTAKLRLDLSKKTDAETGFRITAKVLKNKAGGDPLKEAEYTIKFGEGIDQLGSLIEYAMEAGIIERRSSNYYFAGEMIAKGREAVIDQIKADRNLFDQVATAALTKIAEISQPTSSTLNKTSSIDHQTDETSLDNVDSDCVEDPGEE